MPQTIRAKPEDVKPITVRPEDVEAVPEQPQMPTFRKLLSMNRGLIGALADENPGRRLAEDAQTTAALLMGGTSIPLQMAAQGAMGAGRAELEGRDPLKAGAIDAGSAGLFGVAGKALSAAKPLALRMWQNVAGAESPRVAEEVLKAGRGRLTAANTGKLEAAIPPKTVPVREPSGLVDPSGKSLPSTRTREIRDPAAVEVAAAHRAGVSGGASQPSLSSLFTRGIRAFIPLPETRGLGAQALYSAATNQPLQMANALRLALLAQLRGDEK